MNSYPQTITQPRAFASLRTLALFAVIAAFLLVTGTALALGAFHGDGNASSPQERPSSGIFSGAPGKP